MKHAARFGAWALALAILLVACGPADETTATVAPAATEPVTENIDAEPIAGATAVVGSLEYIETEAGTGPRAEPGDTVYVHYTGMLEDGTVFDSSYDRGQPFVFILGEGQVIAGWDQGIARMNEGGKATLIIPANSTLTFEVELVTVTKPLVPVAVIDELYEETENGIRYYDINPGDGESVTEGDRIAVQFTVWTEGGDFLANSRDQGFPSVFTIGIDDIFFNDWLEGIVGMKVGGLRQLLISQEVGGEAVPPDQGLIFEMEIVEKVEMLIRAEVAEEDLVTTDSGLRYFDLVQGEGPAAEAGDTVTIGYTGWLLEDEGHFDRSAERGDPPRFVLGAGNVMAGWDEGIAGMQVGGRRQLIIPADLAFGEEGLGRIPPNATVVFEIELVEIESGQ
jgi:peptidylprolyl isomerase